MADPANLSSILNAVQLATDSRNKRGIIGKIESRALRLMSG